MEEDMAIKIGINGFGRIGRQVTKAVAENYKGKLEVVVVNDLTDTKTNAYLFKYDSNYGTYPGKVDYTDEAVIIDGSAVRVIAEKDPGKIQWKDYGVEIVIESTGLFTEASKAAAHMNGGAKKVIISAPAKGEDFTVVLGVNQDKYDPVNHKVISNASCTTNCVAPVVKVLNDNFGVNKALMSTIHAYTNDQKILDQFHKDLRRARAAALNIIPTTTGAAEAVTQVIPALVGKIHGMAYRVPTSTVSVVDLVADLDRDVSVDDLNSAFKSAANGALKGILDYCDEPLVSIDFKGNPASSILDSMSTMVIAGNMVKVLSWYDNEWGYSSRVADLASFIADRGL
jgi:glyceraldehyde 3-phosphate dehydrogenase